MASVPPAVQDFLLRLDHDISQILGSSAQISPFVADFLRATQADTKRLLGAEAGHSTVISEVSSSSGDGWFRGEAAEDSASQPTDFTAGSYLECIHRKTGTRLKAPSGFLNAASQFTDDPVLSSSFQFRLAKFAELTEDSEIEPPLLEDIFVHALPSASGDIDIVTLSQGFLEALNGALGDSMEVLERPAALWDPNSKLPLLSSRLKSSGPEGSIGAATFKCQADIEDGRRFVFSGLAADIGTRTLIVVAACAESREPQFSTTIPAIHRLLEVGNPIPGKGLSVRYVDPQNLFSISVPLGWTADNDTGDQNVVLLMNRVQETETSTLALELSILVKEVPADLPLERLAKQAKGYATGILGIEEVASADTVQLGGRDFVRVIGSTNDEGLELLYTVYSASKNERAYIAQTTVMKGQEGHPTIRKWESELMQTLALM